MAVSLNVAEKTLEDLEKEVTCVVCQEHYTDPKILPCLHYYCKECVLRLAVRAGKNKPFSCPECRKDTTLPEGGVEELKSAFFINCFKSMFTRHKKALSKQAHCEICMKSEALAEAFCKQCEKFACKNCVHLHTVMKAIFEGHEIVSTDQLLKTRAEDLIPRSSSPSKCQVHGEFLKIFCFDCNKLICRDCTIKDHRDHNFEFNHIAARDKKKDLMESLQSLREIKNSQSRSIEEVCNTKTNIETQGNTVASTIETSFEELHTILEKCKQQLLEDANRRTSEKIENLNGQEKSLSIASAGVHSVIDYTEQCVRHCSDEEVMSMHTEISQRIQDAVEEHNKPGNSLDPIEEANMGVEVRCAKDLQRLCQKARITSPINYIEVNNLPSTAEVDKKIKIEIFNTIKTTPESKLNLECEIKCVPTGAVIQPKIKEKTPDRYQISYTPSVRGQHELSIRAYGQPIPGSPFTMTVYMSPTQLDKPVKVWEDVADPHSIAVNSKGELSMAEKNGDIVVLDNEGKILRHIEHHEVEGLHSVAVDNEDNIYFVGMDTNKIGKANKNGDILLVRDIKVKQDDEGYWDIAVVGDEVMVTEHYNDGYIMIYDKELNYVRQITSRNKTTLAFLSPDQHGNLYISDYDSIIQVISKTGDFIRSFSCDSNGVQQLDDPDMVHVCGQYVYVADRDLEKTVVFTTEGDYVTTFGCYGGICVNQDGFLYIGDCYKNKITCY